jgi:hypothetical protein
VQRRVTLLPPRGEGRHCQRFCAAGHAATGVEARRAAPGGNTQIQAQRDVEVDRALSAIRTSALHSSKYFPITIFFWRAAQCSAVRPVCERANTPHRMPPLPTPLPSNRSQHVGAGSIGGLEGVTHAPEPAEHVAAAPGVASGHAVCGSGAHMTPRTRAQGSQAEGVAPLGPARPRSPPPAAAAARPQCRRWLPVCAAEAPALPALAPGSSCTCSLRAKAVTQRVQPTLAGKTSCSLVRRASS